MDEDDSREIPIIILSAVLMALITSLVVVIVDSRRERRLIETHESGHAVVAWASGMTPLEINVYYGSGETVMENMDSYVTPERYLSMVLGGVAAEKLILNKWWVVGSISDLNKAEMAAYAMTAGDENCWGMYAPTCHWLECDNQPMTNERMGQLIDQGIKQATFILQNERPQFDAVMSAVAGRDSLNEQELRRLLP